MLLAKQPAANALLRDTLDRSLQIWVISRYYGDDVRMSNLLERISHGLQVGERSTCICCRAGAGSEWRWCRHMPAGVLTCRPALTSTLQVRLGMCDKQTLL